jgi:hypothetical protein
MIKGNKLPLATHRHEKAKQFWLNVATDVSAGIPLKEIAKRYKNPNTKKHYTYNHIYWVVKQLNLRSVN